MTFGFVRALAVALTAIALAGLLAMDGGLQFADIAKSAKAQPAGEAPRKIKYYRNPMGLPDTSPVPKQDSMGMDYIPVYEGEDSDDGSIKLSPGKIQRSGAKSEPVVRQPVRSIIRAPGTVQEDERRISVVTLRFEGFVESVASVMRSLMCTGMLFSRLAARIRRHTSPMPKMALVAT